MDDSDRKDADKLIIDGEEESESLLSLSKRKQEQGNKAAISPPSKKSKLENGSSEEGQEAEARQEEEATEESEPSSLVILEDDTVDSGKGRHLAESSVTEDEEERSLDSVTRDIIAQNVENITTPERQKGRDTSPLTEIEELDIPEELKKGVRTADGLDRVVEVGKAVETVHEVSSSAETEVASQEESEVLRRQFTQEIVLPKESDILKGENTDGLARPLTTKEEEKLGLSGLFEGRSLENSLTEGLDKDGAPRKDVRPNFFVGVKISNAEIHQAIVKIQEDLIAFEPKFARALIDVATSHLTLLVAHIDNEEKLCLAISALDECKKKLTDFTTEPVHLTFSGVGHFSNQVVYAKLVEDEHYHRLLTLATEVRQVFSSMGVCMPDVKDLNPHLTIAKTSKAPHRKGKHFPRKFDPSSYQQHQDTHFGCQYVFGLQLLSMNKPKDKERITTAEKRLVLVSMEFPLKVELNFTEKTNHTVCCFPRRPLQPPENGEKQRKRDSDSNPNLLSSLAVFVTCAAAALILAVAISRFRR
ncbi:putative A-kinase anchor protein 7 isoform gamma isoform X1 [Penaeus vannamei]|uniref:Putative A-kinase anchor protein 7 isoform gamma isoform X1 n=1 Tax=Penaeus vannamei TaxID=6689 RepID=A0A423SPQ1_PENVA|nr:putative A-kinase anchor protein 7 isoform gamma isoform X1 [Penaeus vannamei]